MTYATFQFFAELNDFLPSARRQVAFEHSFAGRSSVKDVVESLGVPHTEVAALLVDDRPVGFGYLVNDGDRVQVYPASVPVAAPPLRPPPAPDFVLDAHLGQLAAYLRMLGFDTLYRNDFPDEELAQISSAQSRILLTRDRGLLKRSIVVFGYYMRQTDPKQQVVEVLRRYELFDQIRPFRRCIRCNGLLRPAARGEIGERLPARTLEYYDEFHTCQTCGQLYWKGSHYERMRAFIAQVRGGHVPAGRGHHVEPGGP